MRKIELVMTALSPAALLIASCSAAQTGDDSSESSAQPFAIEDKGTFDSPWATAFAPGTQVLFITEKPGTMKFVDLPSGRLGTVTGLPQVAVGGQGGLGDVAFLESESSPTLDRRTIYLTWAEAAGGGARNAALGKGTLVCEEADACRIEGLEVVWRQSPKVASPGHFSHRIEFSPDSKHLFLGSGERMQGDPAQDLATNLGKVLRLNLDGTPAAGNPFAGRNESVVDDPVTAEIWSYGHRNIAGLQFDLEGQLWDLEHGPRGGDEINKVESGANYGWPVRSNGDDYDGDVIPDHSADDGFVKPAISWNPVIAPGDFIFYSGKLWPEWRGQALAAGLASQSVVRVSLNGGKGTEEARYGFDKRLRDIVEGPDGAIYVIEDGTGGRLLKLTPAQ